MPRGDHASAAVVALLGLCETAPITMLASVQVFFFRPIVAATLTIAKSMGFLRVNFIYLCTAGDLFPGIRIENCMRLFGKGLSRKKNCYEEYLHSYAHS